MILVNAFDKNNKANSRPLREAVHYLKGGGALGIFPSGAVSHLNLKKRRITDPEWSETLAGLVQMTGATVVPVHFSGRNSFPFNVAGMIHPMLRTALLPREMMKRKKTIQVRIGRPVSGAYISSLESRKHMTDYLRMRCYLLKDQREKQVEEAGHGRHEETIPNLGMVEMEDEETGELMLVNTGSKAVRTNYNAYYRGRVDYFQDAFLKSGAGALSCRVDESYVKKLLGYFKRR